MDKGRFTRNPLLSACTLGLLFVSVPFYRPSRGVLHSRFWAAVQGPKRFLPVSSRPMQAA